MDIYYRNVYVITIAELKNQTFIFILSLVHKTMCGSKIWTNCWHHYTYSTTKNTSSRFSSNSEASALKLLENFEEIFPRLLIVVNAMEFVIKHLFNIWLAFFPYICFDLPLLKLCFSVYVLPVLRFAQYVCYYFCISSLYIVWSSKMSERTRTNKIIGTYNNV